MSEKVRIVPGEDVEDPYVHFAGIGSSQATLCGWFDLETKDAKPSERADCPQCWAIVDYCKAIRARRPPAPAA